MALKKCSECGKEISSEAKICPNCGKKQITIGKVISWIAFGILVIWIISLFNRGEKQEDKLFTKTPTTENTTIQISYPQSQNEFHLLNSPFPSRYNSGINEIQKSTVFNECNQARKNFLKKNNFQIIDWTGKITSIGTDQGGDFAYIEIKGFASGITIIYKTWNNGLLDLFTTSMLKKGTKVYNQVGELKEGTIVKFSGRFIEDNKRGVEESSMTELGCVESPEFILQFDGIVPFIASQSSFEKSENNNKAKTAKQKSTIQKDESDDIENEIESNQ